MNEQAKQLILDRIDQLCKAKGVSSHTAFTESGVGKNFKSNFKNANPSPGKLTMLAHYFGVSLDYLLGNTDDPTPQSKESDFSAQNEHERALLLAYRAQPRLQVAVDRILGIEMDDYVMVYSAAKSEEDRPERIVYMRKDKWEALLQSSPDDLTLI